MPSYLLFMLDIHYKDILIHYFMLNCYKEHYTEMNGTLVKQFSKKKIKLISASLKYWHHRQLCFLDERLFK